MTNEYRKHDYLKYLSVINLEITVENVEVSVLNWEGMVRLGMGMVLAISVSDPSLSSEDFCVFVFEQL